MDNIVNAMITNKIQASISVKQALCADAGLISQIQELSERIIDCYRQHSGVVYFCGNGGSAADSQHLAAEFVGRFYRERDGLPSNALTTNTSILTAIGNDYSFDRIFSRQVEAFCRPHDVLIGISTSGNSVSVMEALKAAKKKGVYSVGWTGESGGKMKDLCDSCLCVPSRDTPRIQECHILIGHIICELVEAALFA